VGELVGSGGDPVKSVQETKVRLIGSALDMLGTAIWLDEDGTISHDVVTLHHLLAKEFRMQLHAMKGEAQKERRATCATA
jgi:hypothetical protein